MARILGAKLIVKITRDGDDDPITTKRKRIGGLRAGIVYSLPHRLAHKIVGLNPSAIASAELAGWGEKTVLIRNGVDSQLHAEALSHRCHLRREHHVSQSTRILIFVGFLARHKGVLDLLDAWDSLSDSDSLLWLVGPYSGFYRELDSETGSAVLAAAARDERIKLFGAVPMNQIPSLLAAADVFVLPSYVEGMPNSLLEAMVSGCKVVGTDIPGIRELCTGGDILIVPPGDSSALAEALRGAMKEAGKGPRVLGRPDLLLASTVDQLEGLYLADSR